MILPPLVDLINTMDIAVQAASREHHLRGAMNFGDVELIRKYQLPLPKIPCHAAQLQQALVGIIKNAAEAMHLGATENPRLVLRVKSDKASRMLQIEIEDNGPGISLENRNKIYDPFFSTKPDRAGLGLSIAYFIVTQVCRGNLRVESLPYKGTNVIIRLPLG